MDVNPRGAPVQRCRPDCRQGPGMAGYAGGRDLQKSNQCAQ